MTLVIGAIIKTSALFLRIHVERCEFYVQKTYFGYIWEVFLLWTVVKANSRSKNIHYFFSTGSLLSMVYYWNTIWTNRLNRLKSFRRLDYWKTLIFNNRMNEMKANHHRVVDPHVEKRKKTEISVFPQNGVFWPLTPPFVPHNTTITTTTIRRDTRGG